MNNAYLTTLGLALRADKLVYGDLSVREAIHTRHTALVLLSSDAGAALQRTFRQLCKNKNIPLLVLPDSKAEIGAAIGKGMCAVAAVLNKGLAEAIAAKAANQIGGGHI